MVFIFSVIRRQCCQSAAMRNKMGKAQSANCLRVNKKKLLGYPNKMASWRFLKICILI
ncbi:hypothetical protein T09_13018 [Trichinella sp. T9]|nr:hypothetical protein T09_13018 [Trichinella sp. T9]